MIRSRKLLSTNNQKTLQTGFFRDQKIFKVKQLYNPHNDAVYLLKKIRQVEVPEERFFNEIEAFSKQIIVSVAILETNDIVESNTTVNPKYYFNVLLKKMIP